jgi:hypothetical protein
MKNIEKLSKQTINKTLVTFVLNIESSHETDVLNLSAKFIVHTDVNQGGLVVPLRLEGVID